VPDQVARPSDRLATVHPCPPRAHARHAGPHTNRGDHPTGHLGDPVVTGVPSPGALDGRVAIVTGAARGIGAATAAHLAELGARVAVTDKDGDGARDVADRLTAAGHDSLGLTCDVADAGGWRRR
jgi:hypothetical protein